MFRLLTNRTFARVVTALVLAAFSPVAAETVVLMDGSRVTGTITEQNETQVVVKTSYGVLTIDKANVASIEFATPTQPQVQQPQVQQPQVQQPQVQQQEAENALQYDRGYYDGKDKGYDDGMHKAKSEQRSARVTGAVSGWLVSAALALVIVLAVNPGSF